MATDNADQIADWNGLLGQRWATLQREIDGIVQPFGAVALARAAARPGERVLDIGCGCGDTTLALAEQVGPEGLVRGVDVSRPMLDVARAQAGLAGWAHLHFNEADAASAALGSVYDLLFSRFGVMFFAEPVAAFAHLRAALRPGGRVVFVCWRTPRDNAWAMAPLQAARQALGLNPPAADPHAPGPFAFADDARLRTLLGAAGLADITIERADAPVLLGATPAAAAANALRIGPTSRLLREVGEGALPVILPAVEAALVPFAQADGRVALPGSTWLATARNPG
jgi:SAM-dependent methyltransferase